MPLPMPHGRELADKLKSARDWLGDGKCCGQIDSAGVCCAPACIFGEALKWMFIAGDEIDLLLESVP